jgi:hypothetical protein
MGFVILMGFRGPGGSRGFRVQASGFRGHCSTYRDYFTVLLFYFFKKKNTGTLEQIGQQYIKSLKYKHKIEVKCSKTS